MKYGNFMYFRCKHEGRNEESVARRSVSGREAHLEVLEENKGSEHDRRVEFCSVKCVHDEVRQLNVGAR